MQQTCGGRTTANLRRTHRDQLNLHLQLFRFLQGLAVISVLMNLQCSYADSPYMLISLHPSMSFSPSTSSCLWLTPVTVPLRTAYQRLQRDFQLSFICMCVLLLFKHPVPFRDAAPSRRITIQPRTELTNPSALYIVMLFQSFSLPASHVSITLFGLILSFTFPLFL